MLTCWEPLRTYVCLVIVCSLFKEQEREASLALQLNLLSLLPRLLLRMKRKWLAFLSDYLQMLLRWWVNYARWACGVVLLYGRLAAGVVLHGVRVYWWVTLAH